MSFGGVLHARAHNIDTSMPLHPYSRSHIRREKRKAKQQLAGGELHAISAALSEAIGEEPESALPSGSKKAQRSRDIAAEVVERNAERQRRRAESGKIDEGRGRTLGEKSRRKQVQVCPFASELLLTAALSKLNAFQPL